MQIFCGCDTWKLPKVIMSFAATKKMHAVAFELAHPRNVQNKIRGHARNDIKNLPESPISESSWQEAFWQHWRFDIRMIRPCYRDWSTDSLTKAVAVVEVRGFLKNVPSTIQNVPFTRRASEKCEGVFDGRGGMATCKVCRIGSNEVRTRAELAGKGGSSELFSQRFNITKRNADDDEEFQGRMISNYHVMSRTWCLDSRLNSISLSSSLEVCLYCWDILPYDQISVNKSIEKSVRTEM